MKIISITLIVGLIICCQNIMAQNKININKASTSIDSLIELKMKEAGIVGLGAAIIIDKNLAWTKGYGYADREEKNAFYPINCNEYCFNK